MGIVNTALAAAALAFGSANAATFTVTNLNDSGAGSLRDAVAQANADTVADTVNFAVTGTIVLTSGQIAINTPMTIAGPGTGSLTIDGNANSRIFSIYENVADVCATPGTDFQVNISDLTISNGRRTQNSPGGAIYSEKSLSLTGVVVSNSEAKAGGGLTWFTRYDGQSLSIVNSLFTGNIARPQPSSTASFDLQRGGGVLVDSRCASPLLITGAQIDIESSVFENNRILPNDTFVSAAGAGLDLIGNHDITIRDSRITGNAIVLPDTPPAGFNYRRGGLGIGQARTVSILNTEISDNRAQRQSGLAVFNDRVDLQTFAGRTVLAIGNSTISGNVAEGSNVSPGGVLLFANVEATFYNSTVSANTTSGGQGGIRLGNGLDTGGTDSALPPLLTLFSTIVSGNDNVDIGFDTVTITSVTVGGGNSLTGVLQSGVSLAGPGNISSTTPGLGPLAFNGGNTRTQALLGGSPAIDQGSNPNGYSYDQRGSGFPRTLGAATDIGAFESPGAPPPRVVSVPIPTLSEIALALLALLTGITALATLRRRS